jgi:hypothetical protein
MLPNHNVPSLTTTRGHWGLGPTSAFQINSVKTTLKEVQKQAIL